MASDFARKKLEDLRCVASRGGKWRVDDALMRPFFQIMRDKIGDHVMEVTLTTDDEVIQAFGAEGANPAFCEWAHVGSRGTNPLDGEDGEEGWRSRGPLLHLPARHRCLSLSVNAVGSFAFESTRFSPETAGGSGSRTRIRHP